MCEGTSSLKARRELRIGGGRIVQCLVCQGIGVELGNCYLTFDRQGFDKFARGFPRLLQQCSSCEEHGEKIYIKLTDGGIMLALTISEIRSIARLMAEALEWLGGGHLLAPAEAKAWSLSTTTH